MLLTQFFTGTRAKFAWCAFMLVAGGVFAKAAQAAPLMRDFIGINGHTVQFKPELYRPVCRLARDYHPVEWDLGTNTSELPAFPFAKNRVDWRRVYGSWVEQGWRINVSLMFESVARTNWTDLESDARRYGEAFAREFGPSGERKLVESIEIGNEPGKWSDADYRRIFQAMGEGLRRGDPALKIATCNLTVGASGEYEKSVGCVEGLSELLDVLNVHTYAQLEGWPTWRRSFPEDPRLPRYLKDVEDLCAWRDAHARGKPVWITEFGYDSSTKKPPATGDFAKWEGVSDEQQAQWIVRSLLVFSALPVDRAYIYFFNDDDQPSVHASAGITRHFQPKPSFHALSHLQRTLGDYRFGRVITNIPGGVRIQEYRGDSGRMVWAAWLQSGENKSAEIIMENTPGKLSKTERMPLGPTVKSEESPVPQRGGTAIRVRVDESPIYLTFESD